MLLDFCAKTEEQPKYEIEVAELPEVMTHKFQDLELGGLETTRRAFSFHSKTQKHEFLSQSKMATEVTYITHHARCMSTKLL